MRSHCAVQLTLFQCCCKLGLQFEAIDPPCGPIMPRGQFHTATFSRTTVEIAPTGMSIYSHPQCVQLSCLCTIVCCHLCAKCVFFPFPGSESRPQLHSTPSGCTGTLIVGSHCQYWTLLSTVAPNHCDKAEVVMQHIDPHGFGIISSAKRDAITVYTVGIKCI